MAGHAKGKVHCGVILTSKRCSTCDALNHLEDGRTCRSGCAAPLEFWCERKVAPGTRCDTHPGRTDVAAEAPLTLAAYAMRGLDPELRVVLQRLAETDQPTETLKAHAHWMTGRAVQTQDLDYSRAATEAVRRWAEARHLDAANKVLDLSVLTDAELDVLESVVPRVA